MQLSRRGRSNCVSLNHRTLLLLRKTLRVGPRRLIHERPRECAINTAPHAETIGAFSGNSW